jgi:hypothetical protein
MSDGISYEALLKQILIFANMNAGVQLFLIPVKLLQHRKELYSQIRFSGGHIFGANCFMNFSIVITL